MENENLDLDVKPTGNKDLWLFLIVVDIVLLCVFGFFLYKHFSVRLFQTPTAAAEETIVPSEEEIDQVIIPAKPAEIAKPAPVAAKPKPAAEKPVARTVVEDEEDTWVSEIIFSDEEPAKPAAKPAETKPAAKPAETKPAQTKPADTKPAAKNTKKSVIVAANSQGKYRRVTFRWFGGGKKVEIVSGFTMTKPQALTKKDGYWEITLSISPGTYKFLYIIDGQNRTDPYSPEKDGRSVVVIQ